jgi:hypothetical protein
MFFVSALHKRHKLKNYYLAVLLLLPLSMLAQKNVDLDRFYFNVQFRSLPGMRLDSSYRTYNVAVESSKLMQNYMADMEPENSVLLDGWRKLPKDGHITIKVKIDDMLPQSVSVKERVENIKNKTGQVTGTRTFYWQEVVYTFAAAAIINDYKGMHIMDQVLADRENKQVYKSPEFPIRTLAEGYFVLNSLTVSKELFRNCVTTAMHTLSQQLTDNFGFKEVTARDQMWIVDSRKHEEYNAHRKAFRDMNEIIFGMNANTSIENARTQLKPVIDYFESVKRKYPTTSKHDRKIRYASYYNLAVLYYYLDDPQMMMKEANGLVLNDFDAKDGKNFERTALWLKNQFEVSRINTRHFSIDTSSFKGPYESSTVKVKKLSR